MQLTISARNAEELKSKVRDLAAVYGIISEPKLDITHEGRQLSFEPSLLDQSDTEDDIDMTAAMPKKRGPKPKVKDPIPETEVNVLLTEAMAETMLESTLTPAAHLTTLTHEDVAGYVKKLGEKEGGLDIARNILAEFNCTRIKELKPEQFAPFIEKTKASI